MVNLTLVRVISSSQTVIDSGTPHRIKTKLVRNSDLGVAAVELRIANSAAFVNTLYHSDTLCRAISRLHLNLSAPYREAGDVVWAGNCDQSTLRHGVDLRNSRFRMPNCKS